MFGRRAPVRVPRFVSVMGLCTSLVVGSLSTAFAKPASETTSTPAWSYTVEGFTDFPLAVGVGLQAESPQGILLTSQLGRLPGAYVNTINAIAKSAEWYGDVTADLISAALEDAFVWRNRIGWRPWRNSGFSFGAGYAFATLDGGLGSTELIEAVTGSEVPSGTGDDRTFEIDTLVHFVDLEVGWRILLAEQWVLRMWLGGSFTVASSTQVSPSWTPRPFAASAVEGVATETEEYLDEIITQYVHTATAGVSLGWQF